MTVESTQIRQQAVSQGTVITRNSVWRLSSGAGPALRIGVLVDNTYLERCFAAVLEDIRSSNFAKLEIILFRNHPPSASPALYKGGVHTRAGTGRQFRHALYNLYLSLDRHKKTPHDPLERIDCSELLSGIESMRIDIAHAENLSPESLLNLRSKGLDVILNFSSDPVAGDIQTAARFGIWSYRYGDPALYRGESIEFWEMSENSPTATIALETNSGAAAGKLVLGKSVFARPKTASMAVSRFAPYWGASELVIRKLNELHRFGWDYLGQHSLSPQPYQGKRLHYHAPGNAEMLRWLVPTILKKSVVTRFHQPRVQHWKIGIRIGAKPLFETESKADLAHFRWLEAPRGYFWADPFAFENQDRLWMFFEEYSYQAKRAWISAAEIGSDGQIGPSVRCLDTPGRHHSYPYIFRDGNDVFMIPEAYDSESVDLYRCLAFPHKWTPVANLLRGKFVDTSVWKHDGLWWMMTTNVDPNPLTACLFLFYSESLTGPWRFHPDNPISCDVHNNRGAGKIFRTGERWIRPSQSCAPTYGYSFTLNEVVEISTARYRERPILTVTPSAWKALCAVHTYNWLRNVELIDAAAMLPLRAVR
ncbi:MAG TPA: hypothetical protein VF011_18020 [Terriglobales bacterium]